MTVPAFVAEPLGIEGLLLVTPRVFQDPRGFFLESYRRDHFRDIGIDVDFVQDNHSRSQRGVVRGMHFQTSPGQAKLVRVSRGKIFDVAVDLRPESPTFGHWEGCCLDAEHHRQIYLPRGFAHGFCVESEVADVQYKVSSPYDPTTERGFRWDDPEIGIRWPLTEVTVSERDGNALSFAELRRELGW